MAQTLTTTRARHKAQVASHMAHKAQGSGLFIRSLLWSLENLAVDFRSEEAAEAAEEARVQLAQVVHLMSGALTEEALRLQVDV